MQPEQLEPAESLGTSQQPEAWKLPIPQEQRRAEPQRSSAPADSPSSARFEKFTAHARKALALAERYAGQMRSSDIRSEHLLLGLLGVKESAAALALAGIGLDLTGLEFELAMRGMGRRQRGAGAQAQAGRRVPASLTDESKRIIEHAVTLAREAGQPKVGTEHLLLALLDEEQCAADTLLRGLHYPPEIVRMAVAQALARRASRETATSAEAPAFTALAGTTTATTKSNIVTCRLDDQTLAAVDMLVEVGIRSSRSDAVAWLIVTGLRAHQDLFTRIQSTAEAIRQLRSEAATVSAPFVPPIETP